ncbi:16S rRNA (adenine(1518)-N(6)/adenine(1519)-N(6))-dimethyltransferase RsmA [Dermacoccaceae bacterium W4C1]
MVNEPFADDAALLGASRIRELAAELGLHPTKQWGQNFVIDANTVRKIVRLAGVGKDDVVVEIGPGLGSLTLPLLQTCAQVTAVEVDPALAQRLPTTVAERAPQVSQRLQVLHADAMKVTELPGPAPTALVANLPYNVSVPVLLRFLELFPSLRTVLVMVQLEVAQRLAAEPGSKIYGVPSVKAAWYGTATLVDRVGKNVFWPAPRIDSGLVRIEVGHPREGLDRQAVFRVVDAAFAQRRKTLRSSLSGLAGSGAAAEKALLAAGVDPGARGERLGVDDFARVAAQLAL